MSEGAWMPRIGALAVTLALLIAGCDASPAPAEASSRNRPTWPPEVIQARAEAVPPFTPVSRLLVEIRSRGFSRPSDVATGRFLHEFERKARLLRDADCTRLSLLRRGPGWVQVTAPVPSDGWDLPDSILVLRLTEGEGAWKIEDAVLKKGK